MKRQFLTLIVAMLACVATFAADWTALTLGEAVTVPTGITNWSVTADMDGTMTLEAAEGGYWVGSMEVYSDAEGANPVIMDDGITNVRFAVTEGSTYYITVWNNDGQEGSLKATVAKVEAVAYPALQLGEVFTVTNMGTEIWTYTADKDGILNIAAADEDSYFGACLNVYADAAMVVGIEQFYYGPARYEVQVKAGTTYYISNNNWSGQNIQAKLSMGKAFAMVGAEPEDGGMFYITSNNTAKINFTSASVTFTEGEITANGNVIKIYNFTDYNSLVKEGIFTYTEEGTSGIVNWNGCICARTDNGITIDFTSQTGTGFFNVINKLIEDGKLKANDPIKLALHGVKSTLTDELLNGDGNIELTWYCAGAPTTLQSANVPETILSWYNAGDQSGIATFTFSKEIKSAAATLEMGNGEASDLYFEQIDADHIIIEGATVKVDLSGMMRTLTTMGLKSNWGQFTLRLTQVVDIDGQDTFSEDQGSASTYTYTTKYKDISQSLTFEITPANGKTLTADDKTVEIWCGNADLIEYDGVTVTYYTVETVKETVPENVYNEETGEWETVTREVETEQNIAHETFIPRSETTEYNDPVDGLTITFTLPEGTYKANNVCVKLNITSSVDGLPHVVAAYYNTQLAYGLDIAQVANPANESEVSRLKEIYLPLGFVYSINPKMATVTVSSRTRANLGTGVIVADGKTNAKIVLDEAITEEGAYIISVSEGAIGDYIYGESNYMCGTTHEAFELNYSVDGRYAGLDLICEPASGTTVNKLDRFDVTFFDYNDVAPSWNNDKYAYVKDADGTEYTGEFVSNTSATNTVSFTLDSPITAAGTYTFVLTGGSVVNGATGDPINTTYEFTFTVDGTYVPAGKPVLDPAEGTLDEIANIMIDFGQPVTLVEANEDNNYWVPQPTLISTDNGETLYAGGLLVPTENPNIVQWNNWGGTAVKACDAEFTIPAGCVQFANGTTNEAYTYTYTISGANMVTINVVSTTPEQWSEVEQLDELTITFDQPVTFDEWSADVTLNNYFWTKSANGTLTTTDNPNTLRVVFAEPVTGFGSATLTINGYTLKNAEGKYYEESIYINLTIGEDEGGDTPGDEDPVEDESIVITPAANSTVASLKYFEITFGGYAGAWNEKPITLTDQAGNIIATVGAYGMSGQAQDGTYFWEQGKDNTYSNTLPNEITTAGTYVLNIPVVCEKPNGNTVNREFNIRFEVVNGDPDGIKAIATDGNKPVIYTIDGIKVGSINKPGLYIINGRKVFVRK